MDFQVSLAYYYIHCTMHRSTKRKWNIPIAFTCVLNCVSQPKTFLLPNNFPKLSKKIYCICVFFSFFLFKHWVHFVGFRFDDQGHRQSAICHVFVIKPMHSELHGWQKCWKHTSSWFVIVAISRDFFRLTTADIEHAISV